MVPLRDAQLGGHDVDYSSDHGAARGMHSRRKICCPCAELMEDIDT